MIKIKDLLNEQHYVYLLWDQVLIDVANGKIDATEIAWVMKRCNEVDEMLLNYNYNLGAQHDNS
jgi:hypothetical protein